MTDFEINEAIAKACGWRKNDIGKWVRGDSTDFASRRGFTFDIPNYVGDLNAMNEAEEAVIWKKGLAYDYDVQLEKVLTDNPYSWGATARQRAEAFLRTFSLWQE